MEYELQTSALFSTLPPAPCDCPSHPQRGAFCDFSHTFSSLAGEI